MILPVFYYFSKIAQTKEGRPNYQFRKMVELFGVPFYILILKI